MPTKDELWAALQAAQEAYYTAAVQEAEHEAALAPFVGRCFKAVLSSGTVYVKVLAVENGKLSCLSFDTDTAQSKIEVFTHQNISSVDSWVEITLTELRAAWALVKQNIDGIQP